MREVGPVPHIGEIELGRCAGGAKGCMVLGWSNGGLFYGDLRAVPALPKLQSDAILPTKFEEI